MRRVLGFLAAIALLLALPPAGELTTAASAPELHARTVGRIAFVGTRSWPASPFDPDQIYVEQTDGSDLVKLTSGEHQFGPVAWSPDGREIAFGIGGRLGPLPLFVMNADGTNQMKIVSDGFNSAPDWSPDGTTIAFSRKIPCGNSQPNCRDAIFTVGAGGQGLRQVTDGPFEYEPSWSPDGRHLAFSFVGRNAAYVETVDADGTDQRRLTTGGNEFEADWSPRGDAILFVSPPKAIEWVRARTGHVHVVFRCTDPCKGVSNPAWSPNGRKIVFVEGVKRGSTWRAPHLAVMNDDGTHVHRLRTHGLVPAFPAWA